MSDIKKRFDRILAIYMHLQAKPVVTAASLAEKFEVSLRTIYRDIHSLMIAGVPIYGEAGAGYSLVEGYKMSPLQFTREEAMSFVAAEKMMERYTDRNMSSNFSRAMLKMKAILRGSEKAELDNVGHQFLIKGSKSVFNDELANGTQLLIDSLSMQRRLEIHYVKPSDDQAECRVIEAVGIFIEGKFWYLLAYCCLRNDYRQFRLDRIRKIRLLDKPFLREHPELSTFLDSKKSVNTIKIVLRVDRSMVAYLDWERAYFGFQYEEKFDDYVDMYFQCRDYVFEGFARWYLMFADKSHIIEPDSLREEVSKLLRNASERL